MYGKSTQRSRSLQMYPFPIFLSLSISSTNLLLLAASLFAFNITFFASFCSTHAVMIRLSPTTIVLGRSDLKEFERRRQRRREAEMLHQEFARFVVGGPDGPAFASLQSQDAQELVASEKTQDLQTGDGQVANCEGRLLALQTSVVNTPLPIASSLEHDEYRAPSSARSSSATTNEFPAITELEDEHAYVTVGSENPARDSQWTSAPSKDDFDYGGYVEGPDERTSDNTPDRSSSFGMLHFFMNQSSLISCAAPDDVCTPQNIRLPDTNRLRNKIPLPRSPLFLSQNTSSSPEHRPTAGLTPHVESSVAIHNTPGILFAQPARRMRPPPRTFRHQTNSFSFDSSERASAAYEQERMASTSTTDSGSRPAVDLSLHEELHGSSLQSSRATSGASHAVSEPPVEGSSAIRVSDESEQAASTLKDFLFSSPQLSLPPPFSAVSRRVSGVDILPGVEYMPRNPETSPIRSNSDTPVRNGVEGRRPTPSSSPNGFEHVSEMDSSPPVRLCPLQRWTRLISCKSLQAVPVPGVSLDEQPRPW